MNRKAFLLAAATAAALLGLNSTLSAVQAAPATQANALPTTATVAQIVGQVQVRENESAPWKAPKPGMVLPIGAECRTGPKSSITFTLPPNQVVTLDRLGVMKILDSVKTASNFKTDLGMKYGRLRYEVEASGLEHEATIRTPSSALAVRGTIMVVTDDGLGSNATVLQGTGTYHPANTSTTLTLGTAPDATYGSNPLQATPNASPSQVYFSQAATPYFSATSLTGNEQSVVSTNYTVGGLNTGVTTDTNSASSSLNPIATGTLLDQNLAPGDLKFTLVWRPVNPPEKGKPTDGGSTSAIPDLDLVVISPKGNRFVPGPRVLNLGKGHPGRPIVGANDHGTRSQGTEFVLWKEFWPVGTYRYGVHYAAGTDPAVFTIRVTLNGHTINPAFHDTVSPIDRNVNFTIQVPPKNGIPPETRARPATLRKPAFDTPAKPATMTRHR